jgi:type IV secretion system protein VirB10
MSDTDVPLSPVDTPPSAAGPIQGERHVSEVAGCGPVMSKRAGVGVIVAGAAIACGVILLKSEKPNLQPEPSPELTSRPVVRYEAPPPVPVQPAVVPLPMQSPPPLPFPGQSLLGSEGRVAAPPARPPRLLVYTSAGSIGPGTSPVSFNTSANTDEASGAAGTSAGTIGNAGTPGNFFGVPAPGGRSAEQRPEPQEDLQSRLTTTRLTGVSANVLRNQPYLLTTGTIVPCILQTAMDSTLPGLVTCVIPEDVQGKTGLTLLDRGTRVVGEFRGNVRQGIERFFVVWTRAETPQGVVVNLDSPATDPLGRSGLEGEVDRHFWQRFGGALLMTTVDGAIQAGVASASKSGTTTINTGQTQGVIAEMLRGTVNIPPTVRKNQGELVSIFVARDLDFSTVYRVQPTPARYVIEQGRSTP